MNDENAVEPFPMIYIEVNWYSNIPLEVCQEKVQFSCFVVDDFFSAIAFVTGFSLSDTDPSKADPSDVSSMSSSSDDDDASDSKPEINVPNAASSSHCDRCSKCKCGLYINVQLQCALEQPHSPRIFIDFSDEVPKLLKVHNEVLSLLTGKLTAVPIRTCF